ncbi:hypothetical protein B2J88_14715 [Rhodococcus sp. SRB_17]|nr:hypothetical protein [Rhodococcus sp. SRB_17]
MSGLRQLRRCTLGSLLGGAASSVGEPALCLGSREFVPEFFDSARRLFCSFDRPVQLGIRLAHSGFCIRDARMCLTARLFVGSTDGVFGRSWRLGHRCEGCRSEAAVGHAAEHPPASQVVADVGVGERSGQRLADLAQHCLRQ